MKRLSICAVSLLLTVSIVGCATVERTSSDDPFSNQLDTLYAQRVNDQHWMLGSAIVLSLGLIAGTLFTTLNNTGNIDPKIGLAGIITTYTFSAAATGVGINSFVQFNNHINEYLETLRLQTKYYNTIEFSKRSPN